MGGSDQYIFISSRSSDDNCDSRCSPQASSPSPWHKAKHVIRTVAQVTEHTWRTYACRYEPPGVKLIFDLLSWDPSALGRPCCTPSNSSYDFQTGNRRKKRTGGGELDLFAWYELHFTFSWVSASCRSDRAAQSPVNVMSLESALAGAEEYLRF